jgi:AcrR family transcriptional regulator
MARRADHTREELTELALSHAIQMIDDEGFSAFSARGLAKAIGYTVGTLYNVFGSSEALLLAINGRTLDVWYESLSTAVAGKHGSTALHALAKAYVMFSRDYPHRWGLLFDAKTHYAEVPVWYQSKLDRFFVLVEAALADIKELKPHNARSTAHVLWAGIHGLCVLDQTQKLTVTGGESADRLAKNFIDTYLRGLRA